MPYDYTDLSISGLISSTHVPIEFETVTSPPIPAPQLLELRCAKCYNSWPCPTIVEYRAATRIVPTPPPVPPIGPPRG